MPAMAARRGALALALLWLATVAVAQHSRDKAKKIMGLSDADIRRIDEELTEDDEKEEEWKPKRPNIDFSAGQVSAADMQEFMKAADPGPAMVFANLHYDDISKKATEKVSFRWKTMLASAGLDGASAYVITEDKILISLQHGWHVPEIKEFLLQQPETAEIDYKSQRTKGPAYCEEYQAKVDAHTAKSEAAKQARKEEREREEKRKKKAAKRKKAARKSGGSAKDEV